MIKLVLEVIWGWARARFILFYRHLDVDKGSMVVQWLAMLLARKLGVGESLALCGVCMFSLYMPGFFSRHSSLLMKVN